MRFTTTPPAPPFLFFPDEDEESWRLSLTLFCFFFGAGVTRMHSTSDSEEEDEDEDEDEDWEALSSSDDERRSMYPSSPFSSGDEQRLMAPWTLAFFAGVTVLWLGLGP